MDTLDNFLQGFSSFAKDSLGIDTEKNSQLINNTVDQLGKSLAAIDLSQAKKNFNKALNIQNAQKAFGDFKNGVVDVLKPKGVALALGALLGGGLATAYNYNQNKRYKKQNPTEYRDNPEIRYTANLGRLYSGSILGALAGLLIHKYRNKLQQTATNWFLKNKKYM